MRQQAQAFRPATAEHAAWSYVNRNKRSIGLNLHTPEGQKIVHELAARADVLVEGFRPGVMQRLNADYATLSHLNPRLVYCSLSGFGQYGPYRDLPAHDLNYLAISGVLNLIGTADQPPAIPLNLVADYGGASMHGVLGILLALCARQQTGRGQHVDIAYLDATIALPGGNASYGKYVFWRGRCHSGAMGHTLDSMLSTPPIQPGRQIFIGRLYGTLVMGQSL